MPEPLDEEDQGRERDPEADERDVHGERERLHLPRLQQVVLVDRPERAGGLGRGGSEHHGRRYMGRRFVDGVPRARTVEMHVRHMLSKLDCRSRTEATSEAHELGLVEPAVAG
jgi:hypothetical protein